MKLLNEVERAKGVKVVKGVMGSGPSAVCIMVKAARRQML